MRIIRPLTTLIVLLIIGSAIGLIMAVFPKDGVHFAGVDLKFKTWQSVFDTTTCTEALNVDAYLASLDSAQTQADSLMVDSLAIQRLVSITSIQFKDGNSSSLFPFFEKLEGSGPVHVVHYGDSQIETDRITGYVRETLQSQFGGNGPGLISPVPIAKSSHIAQEYSENWKRFTSYGFADGKTKHNKYGVMCSFGRFTPSLAKTEIDSTKNAEAWLEFRPSGMSQSHAKIYNCAKLLLGNHQYPFELSAYCDGSLIGTKKVEPSSQMQIISWPVAGSGKKVKFTFKGPDSPDVYACHFCDTSGLIMSNIALRGSDGSSISEVQYGEMRATFSSLGADLILLQFGGNAVPYIRDTNHAKSYGRTISNVIQYVKQVAPNASILVIGPSDMSTSVDGVYQSWPYLDEVRDAMKEAAFAQNCGFWDMYEVMGGQNSMISWVAHSPPYAGPDYTHFTPAGAKKISEYLSKAILDEYQAWKTAKEKLKNGV